MKSFLISIEFLTMEGREPHFTDPWTLVVIWAHALDRSRLRGYQQVLAVWKRATCPGPLESPVNSWIYSFYIHELPMGAWWLGFFCLFMFLCWCLRNSRKIGHYFSHSCFGQWHWHWVRGSPTCLQEPRAMPCWGAHQEISRTFLCCSNYRLGSDGRLLGVPWKKGVICKQIWETLLKRIGCVDFLYATGLLRTFSLLMCTVTWAGLFRAPSWWMLCEAHFEQGCSVIILQTP